MNIQKEIQAIDRMLEAYGIPIEQFCGLAKIHPRSWKNWREGTYLPQLAKWQQVRAAVEDVKANRRVNLAMRARPRKHPPKHPQPA